MDSKKENKDLEPTMEEENEDEDLSLEKRQKKELEERKLREDNLTDDERNALKLEAQNLKKQGNDSYLRGENSEAVHYYQEALDLCPLVFAEDRGVLFANMGAAHLKMGLKEKSMEDCTNAIELKPNYVKALVRRANLYEECDKPHESLEDFKRVLEIDPKHIEALCAVRRLPEKVKEKDEKLKAEMFDSLKKLGNMVLNPFGLSTDNFKLNQDPNTGGYSVNFCQ